jgi:hypothetical protein
MTIKAIPSISAVVAAALIAGTITILTGSSDPVVASAPLNSGKSDQLDIRPLGINCSQHAWPYFEANCTRDRRMALGKAKAVRIVTADRVSLGLSSADRQTR